MNFFLFRLILKYLASCVVEGDLELLVFWYPLEDKDYRHTPPCLLYMVLGIKSRALYILRKLTLRIRTHRVSLSSPDCPRAHSADELASNSDLHATASRGKFS